MRANLLSEKWIKASILGTIWAASEIVLGSFLHNLRVPFSGNLLTAIGLVILISASRIWPEKGLFWRAGLICAMLKIISPSAILFGPMIAIFSEAILLEASVSILGKTYAGFAMGSMLAMSWNLFQKIFNFIIFYGFNIIEVYTNLLKFAQKQFNIKFEIVWLPIIALLILYCLFGLLSAVIGIIISKKIVDQPGETEFNDIKSPGKDMGNKNGSLFNYSIAWLVADILLLIAALILLNYTSLLWGGVFVVVIITLWSFRYKKSLRQLSKPKFWLFFVIITMVTAFIFTKVQSSGGTLVQGLIIGLQMNFRAAAVITGFSVLGTELYNPRVRDFFLRTYFKELPLALELSFESLPLMIANIPDFKSIIKNPVQVVSRFIYIAEYRLREIKKDEQELPATFILTGKIGQGKTTLIEKVIEILKERKISVAGLFCPKLFEEGILKGYEVVDIRKNLRKTLMLVTDDDKKKDVGRFSIIPEGLELGLEALSVTGKDHIQLVIIDEVGPLELNGRGWAGKITDIHNIKDIRILLVVRNGLVEQVISKWNIDQCKVMDVSDNDPASVCDLICKAIL